MYDEDWLTCSLLPFDTLPWTAGGWYLVAADRAVEAGPFLSRETALAVASWLDDEGLGVHPMPYDPHHSHRPLVVGEAVVGRLRRTGPRRRDARRPLSLSA